MTRRDFAGTAALQAVESFRRRPNVLIVIADQWSGLAVGDGLITPALDSLGADGVRFRNAYCVSPLCPASRASLFTGRLPRDALSKDAPALGEIFGANGYDAGWFGKEGTGGVASRGCRGTPYRGDGSAGVGSELDPLFAREAIEFIRARPNRRFLAVLALLNPRDIAYAVPDDLARPLPGLPPNSWAAPPAAMPLPERARRAWTERQWRLYLAQYALLIENTDWLIGRVLEAVPAEDTIVLFTSDHGEQMGAHQLTGIGVFYEEAVRVPLALAWKGKIAAGQVNDTAAISALDVLPTLCDYAGVRVPDGLPGRSLRPLIEHRDRPRQYVLLDTPAGRALRTPVHKYMRFYGGAEFLFDLRTDPGETRDIAPEPAARTALEYHRGLLGAMR